MPATEAGELSPTENENENEKEKEKEKEKETTTILISEISEESDGVATLSDSATRAKQTQAAIPIPTTTTTTLTRTIIGPPSNYTNRRTWITTERMNELRRRAQEAVKQNKTFTIRGCFSSIRNALAVRGWVEKLDLHRKHIPTGVCQVSYDDLAQGLPKRKPGETRSQYVAKCERNIMSRFLEHMPIDFLWTNRKEKCDYIDQAKNPSMTINKFHRAPFTSKEGLCMQLKDFHWFYEEGTAEMYFPRCYNVWSPEELGEFIENFKLTACMAFLRWLTDKYEEHGYDAVFSPIGKIPLSSIDFAYKRCIEFIESCQHDDIDHDDPPKIWEHDWDVFLGQHQQMTNEGVKIFSEQHQRIIDSVIRTGAHVLEDMKDYWPQYMLDGYRNLWIVKPANKCRGRGIQLMDNLKKILNIINPSIASKSRFVVQKYIERPLIIHRTKFDIRQWFLVTNVQPMIIWMYKESYLRFSSQEYSLSNHHESVHLTNHAVQKRYTNGKRDKRLPNENMWDCYSFQAYLRQIGKHDLWDERIYPGMRKAIVGTMLASQESMDRRSNTFELFGADFMISEDFYPWLIEINSSPDLGATTSVTARMCPQCLEDVIKVVIDRRIDPKADVGNFELAFRQMVPPTPAYMGLNLVLKGKQLISKMSHHQHNYYHQRKERTLSQSHLFRQRTALIPAISNVHRVMPTFNATEYIEKYINEAANSTISTGNTNSTSNAPIAPHSSPLHTLCSARRRIVALAAASTITPCPNLLRTPRASVNANFAQRRRSFAGSTRAPAEAQATKPNKTETTASPEDSLNMPLKRFRSCGPRIPTKSNLAEGQRETRERNPEIIPQEMIRPTTTTASKSEPNLPSLLRSKIKGGVGGGGGGGGAGGLSEGQNLHRISPRLGMRLIYGSSQMIHSANDKKPNFLSPMLKNTKSGKLTPSEQVTENTAMESGVPKVNPNMKNMTAIGKGLSSWNCNKDPMKLTTRSASVYAARRTKLNAENTNEISANTADASADAARNRSGVGTKRMRKRTRAAHHSRNTRC